MVSHLLIKCHAVCKTASSCVCDCVLRLTVRQSFSVYAIVLLQTGVVPDPVEAATNVDAATNVELKSSERVSSPEAGTATFLSRKETCKSSN